MLLQFITQFGVTTHEIGHALGLFHHQQRYDRDDYVIFLKKEVPKLYWLNFAKIPAKFLDTYSLPYDVGSIMHYTPTEFSNDEYLPGLITIDENLQGTMGSLDGPSFLDVQIINRHYQCYKNCNATEFRPACLNGGYTDPKNCTICRCPTGFGGDLCQLIESSEPMKCGGLIPTSSKLTRMRAPPNRRVMIGLQTVNGVCQEGCFTSAVEMKMNGDFRPTGYRFCCQAHSFRRILSKGRNVPVTFFARNSSLEVVLYFRWVVLTPDAEDTRYLNGTQLAEVYKQSDDNYDMDMEVLKLPYPETPNAKKCPDDNDVRGYSCRTPILQVNVIQTANDDSGYVGEYGSDGESYEDFSVYS
ncbi:astacin [Oesophagostomum dentatum]|uniref:Zinc metalloproteinase n=1 Tax=Oesophagostomum dentatum TaxID=61180 RepID=A0A0B1TJU2_OESDE|nr:astacin [Oesophagostomum dentatum]